MHGFVRRTGTASATGRDHVPVAAETALRVRHSQDRLSMLASICNQYANVTALHSHGPDESADVSRRRSQFNHLPRLHVGEFGDVHQLHRISSMTLYGFSGIMYGSCEAFIRAAAAFAFSRSPNRYCIFPWTLTTT